MNWSGTVSGGIGCGSKMALRGTGSKDLRIDLIAGVLGVLEVSVGGGVCWWACLVYEDAGVWMW